MNTDCNYVHLQHDKVETLFLQLNDQFYVIRNYTKDTSGLFTRIISKVSALTALLYNKSIGRIKYVLI